METKVSVLVFSGRPDPQWVLNSKQAEGFMQLWDRAAMAFSEVVLPSKDGYKGLRIVSGDRIWFVYGGLATAYEEGRKISKVDKGSALEKLLLDSAPQEIKSLIKRSGS